MCKKLIILCVAALLSATSMANVVSLSDNAPVSYTVKSGDTLWAIAGLYLEQPWHWPELWQQNPEIKNPHLIYPGDELHLTWRDGKPLLTRIASDNTGSSNPINAASDSVLKQHLTFDTLIGNAELKLAPRVLGNDKGWNYLTMRTSFYVDAALEIIDWYVYRPETKFERKLDKRFVQMVSLKKVAEARLVKTLDAISEFKLVHQSQEVKPNDILLPALGARTGSIFQPHAAPSEISGKLVGHLYGSKYVGLRQIVVVDRGDKDGLNAGHTLSVLLPGASLKGEDGDMRYISAVDNKTESVMTTLPAHVTGTLLVIRSYPYFSLAMVVSAEQPLSANMSIVSAGSY